MKKLNRRKIRDIDMELSCLGSSSSGNCYIFRAKSGQMLILECGLRYSDIQKGIDWKPGDVAGCLMSHEHRDHCKSLPELIKAGIKCYALRDVFESFPLRTRFMCEEIHPLEKTEIGEFTILSLPVMHDVPCLGFVISHAEMGNTLFLTDTMYTEYRIKGLNHIMIEANYADRILQNNIDAGFEPASMRSRLLNSHMELASTIKILKETDLDDVNEVILLHLSGRNSDKIDFRKRIMESIGKPTYIAGNGLKILLNKDIY